MVAIVQVQLIGSSIRITFKSAYAAFIVLTARLEATQ
jgi:hypothetical protein